MDGETTLLLEGESERARGNNDVSECMMERTLDITGTLEREMQPSMRHKPAKM